MSARKRQLVAAVKNLVHSKGSIDQTVFLQDLMEVFGGSRKLAIAMFDEYQNAPAGGLARQKLLQTIQHLIISTTQMNMTKVVNPSDLSDQDIKDMLGDYFGEIEAGRLVAPSAPQGDPEQSEAGAGGSAIPGAGAGASGDPVDVVPD